MAGKKTEVIYKQEIISKWISKNYDKSEKNVKILKKMLKNYLRKYCKK